MNYLLPSYKLRLAALPLFVLFAFTTGNGQTSVVAIRSKSEIVIGADSQGTAGKDHQIKAPYCKIHQFGQTFFASAGFIHSPATGFNMIDVARAASRRGKTIAERVDIFVRTIKKPMETQMEWQKRNSLEVLKRDYLEREPLQVVFAGFEKDIPFLMFRTFRAETSPTGKVSFSLARTSNCPGDCKGDIRPEYLGEVEAIVRYMKEHPGFWTPDSSLTDAVRLFVNLEIADKGEFVSPPVDILKITRDGAKWIERKEQCPEIQNQALSKSKLSGRRNKRKRSKLSRVYYQ